MVEPLFHQASSPKILHKAWDRVYSNFGGPGDDGMTVQRYARSAASRILALSRRLREGSYKPGPARRTYIPKKSGGVRPLDIPCVNDRIAQAGVALVLVPEFEPEFEESSFGYRPGRSVFDAVRRVTMHWRDGFKWVVDADIKRFFEMVSHDRLINQLELVIDDAKLIDLIWVWLEWYRPEGRGLPQGSPVSPLLANFYLDDIDENIAGRGVRLVRYADDFLLLCKSEVTARKALSRAHELLAEIGLEINLDKTRIVDFDQGFRFLGHVFVRSLVFKDTALDNTPAEDAIEAVQAALRSDRQAEAARLAGLDDKTSQELTGSERIDLALSRRWRTLYVLEPKRVLSADGESFTVMEEGSRLIGIPAVRLGRIEVGRGAEITTDALDLASAHGVQLVRLDGYGAVKGKWVTPQQSHARRHMAQCAIALDPVKRLNFARIIATGKLHNQRVLLKRTDRKYHRDDLPEINVKFKRLLRRLAHENSIETLMGREGQAGAMYWRMLSKYLPEGWEFPARKRSPASAPVDVALNITSSLLARDIEVALSRHDLHTGFGILHVAQDHADGLVYDLMEEFRAPIADACVMLAIGRGALEFDMFKRDRKSGWSIDRFGYQALVRTYESHVNGSIKDHVDNDYTTWRGLFERQAERFAKYCEQGLSYKPYRMDY